MKKTFFILGTGISIFVAIQMIRPSIPAPTVRAEIAVPKEATKVLRTSCYSCHSNERRLAWFDEIVPGYWLVRHDVLTARQHLNFSTLGSKPPAAQRAALFEAVNMAELGSMPLKSFVALHPDAKVSKTDLNYVKEFLAPWRDEPASLSEPIQAVAPANAERNGSGLSFDSGYTGWHLLSVTDRGDNNTFRFILGNDIAVEAVRKGMLSPWPDGSRFAKIAWQRRKSAEGRIEPGEFFQVKMMVKNAAAYRSSDGWGWGRWKGPALKPYGSDASVVTECTGCHAPMRRNDFVYTMPISRSTQSNDRLNTPAATLPALPFDPWSATPVTMYVDRSVSTISVLFSRPQSPYDLLLITWKESEDPHWFGARIPGEFLSAEYVEGASQRYTRLLPTGPVPPATDRSTEQERTMFIRQLKVAAYLTH